MLFGCISYEKKGFIAMIEGTINKEKYVEMIDTLIKPFLDSHQHPERMIFIQDNAPPHKAGVSMDRLAELRIKLVPHPPYSPDQNPIELLWAYLERKIMHEDRKTVASLLAAL